MVTDSGEGRKKKKQRKGKLRKRYPGGMAETTS
jgi:uncharacterized protein Veg